MAGKLMQAVRYDRYGGGAAALKHVEVSVPSPSKDEVLIKVEACSLNPIDWKIQKGALRPFLPPKFPHVPATDVAGDVVEVGAGVTKFKVGDKVISKLPTGGGLAEFAVAKENLTVPKPSQVSAVEGSCIPLAGLAAHEALTSAGVKLDGSGQRLNVLITAASGGVGHYAVQLAKLGNTHVTATCGARNIEFVRSLGADEVLDYKTPEGAALKSSSGQKYDVVIHGAAPIPWSQFKSILSSKGKVVDLNPGLGTMLTSTVGKLTCSNKRLIPLLTSPKGENLDYLVKLAREGKLKPKVDSTYPLAKAEDAWSKCIEGHATGKIVVEV